MGADTLHWRIWRRITGISFGFLAVTGAAIAQQSANDPRCSVAINRWSIQLETITLDGIAAAQDDLIIVDPTANGHPSETFTADQVEAMKIGPEGQRRLIFAYLSIGQAEDYRAYWNPSWRDAPPSWLDAPDDEWSDNFETRYWDPDWQAHVFGGPGAMLDDLLDTGFDGAMLDGVDAFEYWASRRPQAADDMVKFIVKLKEYAHKRDPGFLFLALNGENLLTDSRFVHAVSGILKEDLFFGQNHEPSRNPADMIEWAGGRLALAKQAGLPVLVLEYLPPGPVRDEPGEMIDAIGALGSFGVRSLGQLSHARPASAGAITSFADGAGCWQP